MRFHGHYTENLLLLPCPFIARWKMWLSNKHLHLLKFQRNSDNKFHQLWSDSWIIRFCSPSKKWGANFPWWVTWKKLKLWKNEKQAFGLNGFVYRSDCCRGQNLRQIHLEVELFSIKLIALSFNFDPHFSFRQLKQSVRFSDFTFSWFVDGWNIDTQKFKGGSSNPRRVTSSHWSFGEWELLHKPRKLNWYSPPQRNWTTPLSSWRLLRCELFLKTFIVIYHYTI